MLGNTGCLRLPWPSPWSLQGSQALETVPPWPGPSGVGLPAGLARTSAGPGRRGGCQSESARALRAGGPADPGPPWGAGPERRRPAQPPRTGPLRARCFQPVLTHVQTLWELMLLGEPLVVLAPSPTVSSEMVLALTRWASSSGRGVGARAPPRCAHRPRRPPGRPAAACSLSSSAATSARTSPSTTASSRSSRLARRPRKCRAARTTRPRVRAPGPACVCLFSPSPF